MSPDDSVTPAPAPDNMTATGEQHCVSGSCNANDPETGPGLASESESYINPACIPCDCVDVKLRTSSLVQGSDNDNSKAHATDSPSTKSDKRTSSGLELVDPVKEICQKQPHHPKPHKRRNFIVQYFKKKCQNWSRDQFITIVILSFVEFFASAVVSIQAPFYPDVVSIHM